MPLELSLGSPGLGEDIETHESIIQDLKPYILPTMETLHKAPNYFIYSGLLRLEFRLHSFVELVPIC